MESFFSFRGIEKFTSQLSTLTPKKISKVKIMARKVDYQNPKHGKYSNYLNLYIYPNHDKDTG